MPHSEVAYLDFNREQGQAIDLACHSLTELGGPQAGEVAAQANLFAKQLESTLSPDQKSTLRRFSDGSLSALMFRQMPFPTDPPPEQLADISVMARGNRFQYLASRNQVLNCSTIVSNGHSPAPCALILTARWNPAHEPTHVIPLRGIIESMASLDVLALTSPCFDFTRSDCFARGHGNAGKAVSMLQYNANGGFALRYNSYRFSLNDNAGSAVARAFDAFQEAVNSTQPEMFDLQADTALLVNNGRALHGRSIIRDNRRLLVRQFGYSRFAAPIVIAEDPLLVRG